jgi:hypothetical protein
LNGFRKTLFKIHLHTYVCTGMEAISWFYSISILTQRVAYASNSLVIPSMEGKEGEANRDWNRRGDVILNTET